MVSKFDAKTRSFFDKTKYSRRYFCTFLQWPYHRSDLRYMLCARKRYVMRFVTSVKHNRHLNAILKSSLRKKTLFFSYFFVFAENIPNSLKVHSKCVIHCCNSSNSSEFPNLCKHFATVNALFSFKFNT